MKNKIYEYNDNELIYLYKECHNEYALEILLQKYRLLIHRLIIDYSISSYYHDDCFSECIQSLYEAISSYNLDSDKTFMRYAELIIRRKLNKLKTNVIRYEQSVKKYKNDYQEQNVDYEKSIINLMNIERCQCYLKDHDFNPQLFYDLFIVNLSEKDIRKKYNIENVSSMKLKMRKLLRKRKSD